MGNEVFKGAVISSLGGPAVVEDLDNMGKLDISRRIRHNKVHYMEMD